jgi:hypothetical protein
MVMNGFPQPRSHGHLPWLVAKMWFNHFYPRVISGGMLNDTRPTTSTILMPPYPFSWILAVTCYLLCTTIVSYCKLVIPCSPSLSSSPNLGSNAEKEKTLRSRVPIDDDNVIYPRTINEDLIPTGLSLMTSMMQATLLRMAMGWVQIRWSLWTPNT